MSAFKSHIEANRRQLGLPLLRHGANWKFKSLVMLRRAIGLGNRRGRTHLCQTQSLASLQIIVFPGVVGVVAVCPDPSG